MHPLRPRGFGVRFSEQLAIRLSGIGVFVCLLLSSTTAGAQSPPRSAVTTRSPHGDLNIACQNCHTVLGWKPIRAVPEFDHLKTSYPLLGMHEKVSCTQCHTKPVFANTGTRCNDCHADIHHGNMGTTCERCHSVKGWQVTEQSVGNHENRFPLVGAHASLQCDTCHKGAAVGQFQGLSFQCNSCHMADFKRATSPNHVALKFFQTCEDCHSVTAWQPAHFDHNATGFPLTGAHAQLPCSDCHATNNFNLTSTACASCHMKDYNGASNPNHVAGGFPTDCTACHSTSAWQPAAFDHAKAGFPLTGAHAKLQCADCHKNGNFNLASVACVSCHLKDYNGATNPNHVAGGFPQQCDVCHSTSAWQPASFNHNNTPFPLVGAHTSVACASCHVNNNYTSLPTDCYSCHKAEYLATNNPNHIAAGFPTTCQTCHQVVAGWAGATFNHTWFDTHHGGANGICATCHTNPSNYAVFQCTNCHAKASTDQRHQGVNGYVYNSVNCYQCHQSGGGG